MKERNVGTLQRELGLWQWRKETGRAYRVVLLAGAAGRSVAGVVFALTVAATDPRERHAVMRGRSPLRAWPGGG
jgi:hypothetical protein